METNLQHEDVLIKLRAKLNEEKIKLWEAPYYIQDNDISDSLKDLAKQYSVSLALGYDTVLDALHELQLHSVDRSKANDEFKETGIATFRIKVTLSGQQSRVIKVQKTLESIGSDLIGTVAGELSVAETRVKLIFNGKVVKPSPTLQEQGLKNGTLLMALVMAESPEQVKKEDNMYMEMKSTRDDALLLSECIDDLSDDDEYMKLEDQSGKTVDLPAAERRSLLVGLALHERGRAAVKQKEYPLALVLLLEADRLLSECRSSLLQSVDNWAVLQLDVAWCYLCLQSLSSAADAAARLSRAEHCFRTTYGENHQRLIALKGTAANERVLFMRLYLLQGIVSYHQNKRSEAQKLLDKAEVEINALRVSDSAVCALAELGWSAGQARAGLRAAAGDVDRAHHYLVERRRDRQAARDAQRRHREQQRVPSASARLVSALCDMGYGRRLAARALRAAGYSVGEAVRLIQEQPDLLADSEDSSEETETPSSEESLVEPDNKLVAELEAMGYTTEDAQEALRQSRNHISQAVDLLVALTGHLRDGTTEDRSNPSTSAGAARKTKREKRMKKKEREQAWRRLKSTIRNEDDDHLDTSLGEEEGFLAQYKSLL